MSDHSFSLQVRVETDGVVINCEGSLGQLDAVAVLLWWTKIVALAHGPAWTSAALDRTSAALQDGTLIEPAPLESPSHGH